MNGDYSAHAWIGIFNSEEELCDYVDNAFCDDYNLQGEEAADVADDLDWSLFDKTYSALDILNVFGLESIDNLKSINKHMTLHANAGICLYDHSEYKERFEKIAEKAKNASRVLYLGEFYITEPEDIVNEGRYDAEI